MLTFIFFSVLMIGYFSFLLNFKFEKKYLILHILVTNILVAIFSYWLVGYSILVFLIFLFIYYVIFFTIGIIIFYAKKRGVKDLIFIIAPLSILLIGKCLAFFNSSSFILEFTFFLRRFSSVAVIGNELLIFLYLSVLFLFAYWLNIFIGRGKKIDKFYIKTVFVIVYVLFCFCILFWPYENEEKNMYDKSLNIAIVQGNFDKDWVWRYENSDLIFDTYYNLSLGLNKYDLVVWPEYALPVDIYKHKRDFSEKIRDLSFRLNNTIVVGHVLEAGKYHYDSASVFQRGEILDVYNSVEPVIFNEQTLKGDNFNIYEIKEKNLTFGIIICYEELNRDIFYKYNNKNVDFIVSLVNEQQIEGTMGQAVLSDFINLRAKEFNVNIVRGTNTGISKVIDSNGKTLIEARANQRLILNYTLNFFK